jgi:hypothetical protein
MEFWHRHGRIERHAAIEDDEGENRFLVEEQDTRRRRRVRWRICLARLRCGM